jgi:hypothetical protein
MRLPFHIRRWVGVGLSSLIALIVNPLAVAGTDATQPVKTPSHASTSVHKKASASVHKSSTHASGHGKNAHGKRGSKKRGQQAIDSERTREIQTALIREHYLQGSPSGKWDSASEAAMKHYQADHGWQSKTTPDSRALIQLGLGPNSDHLLNPESAMTSAPTESKSRPAAPHEDNLSQQ